MTISATEVARLANLARIELTEQELSELVPKLDVILDALQSVSQFADADVPPTAHPYGLENVLRADQVRPSFAPESMLAGAPDSEDEQFRVPRILDEEA